MRAFFGGQIPPPFFFLKRSTCDCCRFPQPTSVTLPPPSVASQPLLYTLRPPLVALQVPSIVCLNTALTNGRPEFFFYLKTSCALFTVLRP